MPLYDDHFSGHMELGDWRTPLSGAGGCTWPTVPPARWLLKSTNATGLLAVLNFTGIVCLPTSEIDPNHDVFNWFSIAHPFTVSRFRKTWRRSSRDILWELVLVIGSACGDTLKWNLVEAEGPCNHNIVFGSRCCSLQPTWCTGSDFTAHQVEWDATAPP